MNDKVNSNYLNWLIEDVSNRIFLDGNTVVTYKGIKFEFQEIEYANPMDMSCMTMISLNIPFYLRDTINEHLGVSYESQSNSWPRYGKKVSMDRKVACMQLARQFVTKFLPKVDFKLKKDVYNNEIEEILEVLE